MTTIPMFAPVSAADRDDDLRRFGEAVDRVAAILADNGHNHPEAARLMGCDTSAPGGSPDNVTPGMSGVVATLAESARWGLAMHGHNLEEATTSALTLMVVEAVAIGRQVGRAEALDLMGSEPLPDDVRAITDGQ